MKVFKFELRRFWRSSMIYILIMTALILSLINMKIWQSYQRIYDYQETHIKSAPDFLLINYFSNVNQSEFFSGQTRGMKTYFKMYQDPAYEEEASPRGNFSSPLDNFHWYYLKVTQEDQYVYSDEEIKLLTSIENLLTWEENHLIEEDFQKGNHLHSLMRGDKIIYGLIPILLIPLMIIQFMHEDQTKDVFFYRTLPLVKGGEYFSKILVAGAMGLLYVFLTLSFSYFWAYLLKIPILPLSYPIIVLGQGATLAGWQVLLMQMSSFLVKIVLITTINVTIYSIFKKFWLSIRLLIVFNLFASLLSLFLPSLQSNWNLFFTDSY